MKTMITLLALTVSVTAFANTKTIKCFGPVGGQIYSVTGTLQLTPMPGGQMQAVGSIKVNDKKTAVKVGGGYDNVKGFEYASLMPLSKSNMTSIYINFGDSENSANSYIETAKDTFPLNCGQSK